MEIHGHLAALLWVWTICIMVLALLFIGILAKLTGALCTYLTTARVTLNAIMKSTMAHELKAMMDSLSKELGKG